MADNDIVKETPHDVPTVRVKDDEGGYKIINRKDYDAKEHGPIIKGGEDQEQSAFGTGGRNTSGTFSEPTPTDIRYPNKDATEYENNHGAFVNKSAAQMRVDRGMPDEPGGLYPAGAFRCEPIGPNEHRIMSGDREVMRGVSNRDATKFGKMSDEEQMGWMKDKGANPPDLKAESEKKEAGKNQPGTRMPSEQGRQPGNVPMAGGPRPNTPPRR
jgi:hypothetical protein